MLRTTEESIQTRNHIHLNVVQPKMEAAGIVQGMAVNLGDVDRIIGERVSSILKILTQQIVSQIDEGVGKSKDLIEKFRVRVKQIYPDENVIRMTTHKDKSNRF